MPKMTKNQARVLKVLERMREQVAQDKEMAAMYADALEGMLGDISCEDGFGTEGQCDPRGDQRTADDNGWAVWTMGNVEGVDAPVDSDDGDEDYDGE